MYENEYWYEIEHLQQVLTVANKFKEDLAKFEKGLSPEE